MKKGDLVTFSGFKAQYLGFERLKETLDENGIGGCWVPQVRVMILGSMPEFLEARKGRECYGVQRWVARKYIRRL